MAKKYIIFPVIFALLLICFPCESVVFVERSNLPLSTNGKFIIDRNGGKVKLACANWIYTVGGLNVNSLSNLTSLIRESGINCLRIPLSLSLFYENPVVPSFALAANPEMIGLRGMEVLDLVIQNLNDTGIMMILNIHMNTAGWCCGFESESNGLWSTSEYNFTMWIGGIRGFTQRYKHDYVIGFDLKNEFHDWENITQTYGTTNDPNTDWRVASQAAGAVIQKENPNMLIIVGGMCFNGFLDDIQRNLPEFQIPNKLVLTVHTYSGSMWWEVIQTVLLIVSPQLTFSNIHSYSNIVIGVSCIPLFLIAALPTQRQNILSITKDEIILTLSITAIMLCIPSLLWVSIYKYALNFACCSIEAIDYNTYWLSLIIPLMVLSFFGIVYSSKKCKCIGKKLFLIKDNNGTKLLEFELFKMGRNKEKKNNDEINVKKAVTEESKSDIKDLPSLDLPKKVEETKLPPPQVASPTSENFNEWKEKRNCCCCTSKCLTLIILVFCSIVLFYSIYMSYFSLNVNSYAMLKGALDAIWGTQYSTVPIWIGEFGTNNHLEPWWGNVIKYLGENELSFSYWALDGQKFNEYTWSYDVESFGILNENYNAIASPGKLIMLQMMNNISSFQSS